MTSGAPIEKKRKMNITGPVELELCSIQGMPSVQQPDEKLHEVKNVFGEMMTAAEFADVKVLSRSVEIPAHKVVLSTRIPFFKEALLHDSAGENTIEIPPEISPDIVKEIIKYAYLIQPEVTLQNAQALLEAATFFRIEDLWTFCDKFIAERIFLTVTNCVAVQGYAVVRSAKVLARKAEEFIARHLVDIVSADDFRSMSEKEITSILSVKDVCGLPTEEMFWEALVKWIEADVESRKQDMPRLISLVRLPSLSGIHVVQKILAHPYVDNDPVCREMVRDVVSYKLDPSNTDIRLKCAGSFNLQNRFNQMSRIYYFDVDDAIDENDKEHPLDCDFCQRIQVLQNCDGKWVEVHVASMPAECGYLVKKMAVVKNILYCVCNKNVFLLFNFSTNTWTVIRGDMGRPNLAKSQLCCINGQLITCGPADDNSQMLAYCYDSSANTWQRTVLSWPGHCTDWIRCCGVTRRDNGNADNDMLCVFVEELGFATILLFDVETGKLIKHGTETVMNNYDLNSYNKAMVSYDGKVFVAGSVSVKAYHVALDEWSCLPSQRVARSFPGIAIANDRLYVMGGCIGSTFCALVEYLDLTKSNPAWQKGPMLLSTPISQDEDDMNDCFAAAVCECCL